MKLKDPWKSFKLYHRQVNKDKYEAKRHGEGSKNKKSNIPHLPPYYEKSMKLGRSEIEKHNGRKLSRTKKMIVAPSIKKKKNHIVFQAEGKKMNIFINMIKIKRKIVKSNREDRRYAYS